LKFEIQVRLPLKRAYWRITIYFLRPALFASSILAFLLSFDSPITTIILVGNDSTLPIYIFSVLRFGITP
jgi:spermidine/putrescine transport system permease protein